MSKSVLTPIKIYRSYENKSLSLDLAVDYLISYIDEGLKDQRVMALNFLDKLPPNSKSFEYITKLVISEGDNNLRALSANITTKKYFDKSNKTIQWIIENENSIKVFAKLYEALRSIHNDSSDIFKSNIISKVAEALKLIQEETIFILELFAIKLLYYYNLDMILNKNLKSFISDKLSDYSNWAFEGNPIFVINYQHIICVNLRGFKLCKIPNSIGSLSQLAILDLERNFLADLPKEIGFLLNLKELYLGRNIFSSLPECCSTLPNLREIHIESNFLTFKSTSEAMWKIAQYCYVQKYVNEGVYPSEAPVLSLFEMMLGRKIDKLDYVHSDYDEALPSFNYGSGACDFYSMNKSGNVTGIYIHWNMDLREMVCIPKYIYHLKFLRELSMIMCFIAEIPEEIGQLSHIMRINLENNRIESIPKSLELLPNLIYLDLHRNPISDDMQNYHFANKNLVIKIGYLKKKWLIEEEEAMK